jgi:hypothetical protein
LRPSKKISAGAWRALRIQSFADQLEKRTIIHAQGQHLEDPFVRQMVKETFDIRLDNVPKRPVLQVEGQIADRIVRAPSRSVTVTAIQKIRFMGWIKGVGWIKDKRGRKR